MFAGVPVTQDSVNRVSEDHVDIGHEEVGELLLLSHDLVDQFDAVHFLFGEVYLKTELVQP